MATLNFLILMSERMKHVLMHASLHPTKALKGLRKFFEILLNVEAKKSQRKAYKVSPNLVLSSPDLTRGGKPNLSCDLLPEQSTRKLEALEGRKIPPRRHCHSVIQHTASPMTILLKMKTNIGFIGLQLDI